jgi:hypothetical protein
VDDMPRRPRAIAMSAKGKAVWKLALADTLIPTTVTELWSVVNGAREEGEVAVISEPTARAAFNGGPIEPKYWQKIFDALDLQRRQYFSDAEWYQWDVNTQWGMLLDLAVDASDRFGLVPSSEVEYSNDGYRRAIYSSENATQRYPKRIRIGEEFRFNIHIEREGYLFILEKDLSDEVFFLVDPISIEQKGAKITIPGKEDPFTSSIIGKCELWAAVIPNEEMCDFSYLEGNNYYSCKRQQQQPLKSQHLQQLLEFIDENKKLEIIQTYYVVVN